jgi:hypothetical protein
MKRPHERIPTLALAGVLALLAPAIRVFAAASAPKNPPATIDAKAVEADFNRVTLTPKAEERLRIRTVAVERKSVPLAQTYGAEITVALEKSDTAGSTSSQSILPLLPSMAPADRIRLAESQVDADGAIVAAEVQIKSATVAMERADRMLREKSGSQRAVDDARASLNLAQSDLAKAKARRELLGPGVLPGSTPDRVWVRVLVYVGDLQRIDSTAAAFVDSLGAPKGSPGFTAKPVDAPPSANPAASAVDLFFELENTNHRFRLGERVSATVPLKSAADSLVVPWSSVVIDINGGTWVYQNTADHQFVRKRVQVSRVAGDLAVLATGPAVGSKIVTDGAAELFGTEVGFSK